MLMESMLRQRLKLVKRDPEGVPRKLILFPAPRGRKDSADVVIDPRISFGRPVLARLGVPTAILYKRFMAGEDIEELARDYGAPPDAIQNAIRCERRAARSRTPPCRHVVRVPRLVRRLRCAVRSFPPLSFVYVQVLCGDVMNYCICLDTLSCGLRSRRAAPRSRWRTVFCP